MMLCTSFVCIGQKHDTLETVRIISNKEKKNITSPSPVQQLNATDLTHSNSISIADAIKQFAGVQVKDYGGIGGLKTVSVRSLGANHTGVLYDGIALGDAQGGQIDFGKYSLENVVQIKLYNGSPTDILLPARAFSTAALLSIKTASAAIYLKTENQYLKIKLQQGSFGYFAPSIALQTKVSQRLQVGFHTWYQTSKGDYPFTSYENTGLKERRTNASIKANRVEFDGSYFINDSNKLQFKIFNYTSKRGLPGSVILYNNTSNQSLYDNNFFAQASWQDKINKRNEILINGKFSIDKNEYVDAAYPNASGYLENKFVQKELYVSTVYKYNIMPHLLVSVASDFFTSTLNRTDTFVVNFANPSRNTFLNNIALQYKKRGFEVFGNILHTAINEQVTNGKAGRNLQAFAPSISSAIKLSATHPIYARVFYKYIFRSPTFNDLYYTNIGNVNLLPEYAKQLNIGLSFQKNNIGIFNEIAFTTDAYYNAVTNKILAVPRQNLFQWSMQNVGAVQIKGIDATAHFQFKTFNGIDISSNISYTFQQVIDVASNTQLPYTPMHTGSASVNAQYKNINFSYNSFFSAYKYREGAAIAENIIQGFATHDVSITYDFNKKYLIKLDANNIANTQYEIIKYYPMPLFNYRISFQYTLKNKLIK